MYCKDLMSDKNKNSFGEDIYLICKHILMNVHYLSLRYESLHII